MRWMVTIQGMDEFGGHATVEMVIEKKFDRLSKGEIGLSISDGKTRMARRSWLVCSSLSSNSNVRPTS